MKHYRVIKNGPRGFCCGVSISSRGTILDAAPILKKFIGQPFSNLMRWVDRNYIDIEPLGSIEGVRNDGQDQSS